MITMKRTFSIILAVFILVSAIPFTASAAEPETLKATNVTKWPTISYKNGGDCIYFGQTVGDTIIINDDEIVLDAAGNQVPGHFVHNNDLQIPDASGTGERKANIKFVPDDTTKYTEFKKLFCSDVTFNVAKVTPVPVDENNVFPVATEVEAGAELSTSTLTNPAYTNPYNASEPKILEAKWLWLSSSTIVNESGYHKAFLSTGSSYTDMFTWVLVRVKGDTSEVKIATSIEELPTVEGEYYVGDKWADVKLVGGKAVDMDGNPVSGTFNFDTTNEKLGVAGTLGTRVKFTPDDSRYATAKSSQSVNFTVNKAPVKFVDSEGKEIVPEIELGYNTKDLQYNLSEIKALLAPYANCGEKNFYCNWQDLENKDLPYRTDSLEVNTTKEYIIRGLSYDSDNYAPAMLTFKLKVVPRKLTATVRYTGNSISVDTTKPLTDKLYGTFEYYANGEKVGTSQITTTTDSTGLPWKPEKSGVYDITVKFVPDEKDVYYFDDTTVEDMEIICAWGVTVENGTVKVSNSYKENGSFKYGADVSVQSKTNASFSHWIVTDTKGNEIEIEGFDKNNSYNTFRMPDFSVNFKAVDLTQRKITCVNCFVKNAVGSADAPIRYKGQKVSIGIDEAALPLEKFAGWEITDSNGNAYMPEGLTEEALASTNIEFTMPDFDITVKAKNVDDEKGDGFFAQVKAFFENLFNGETECPVLKWIIKVFNAIVNFFTGLFVK